GLTYEPSQRRGWWKRTRAVCVRLVSEGGLEPPRAMRPLVPQPSASTWFRHSDACERILSTGSERPVPARRLLPLPGQPERRQAEQDASDDRDPVEPALEGGAAAEGTGAAEHVRQPAPPP